MFALSMPAASPTLNLEPGTLNSPLPMSAAATIPFTAAPSVSHSPHPPVSPSPSLNPEPRTLNPPWSPTDRDRLIFQWVKFDGHKQSWVATQLGIHQTTVSRIIDRYERWIAHGGPSQQGGLSRDERLRAQRWLTFERNEWILNSALRIAAEMETPIDISTSNIKKTPQDYTKELEIRTQHATLHRSGLACRFLRLAHRINMDQKKLVEQDPLPDLEPLSSEDLDQSDDLRVVEPHVVAGSPERVVAGSLDPANSPTEGLPAGEPVAAASTSPVIVPACTDSLTPEPPPPTHKMHTSMQVELDVTDCSIDLYAPHAPSQKISAPAYHVASSPPERTPSASSVPFTPPDSYPLTPVSCPP